MQNSSVLARAWIEFLQSPCLFCGRYIRMSDRLEPLLAVWALCSFDFVGSQTEEGRFNLPCSRRRVGSTILLGGLAVLVPQGCGGASDFVLANLAHHMELEISKLLEVKQLLSDPTNTATNRSKKVFCPGGLGAVQRT